MKERIFDDKSIEMATKITLWEKIKLFFHKKQSYIDPLESVKVDYKVMAGKVYVVSIYDTCSCETKPK